MHHDGSSREARRTRARSARNARETHRDARDAQRHAISCHNLLNVIKWYHVKTWFHPMTWYLTNPDPCTGSPSEFMSSYFRDSYKFSQMPGVRNNVLGLTLWSYNSTYYHKLRVLALIYIMFWVFHEMGCHPVLRHDYIAMDSSEHDGL